MRPKYRQPNKWAASCPAHTKHAQPSKRHQPPPTGLRLWRVSWLSVSLLSKQSKSETCLRLVKFRSPFFWCFHSSNINSNLASCLHHLIVSAKSSVSSRPSSPDLPENCILHKAWPCPRFLSGHLAVHSVSGAIPACYPCFLLLFFSRFPVIFNNLSLKTQDPSGKGAWPSRKPSHGPSKLKH